jgi:prolyl-tRNA synthetase
MRFSKLFIPTLRESPSDAEVVSHRLMTRAGMIRKVAAGIYNLLPLGSMVVSRVEAIVREEMTRAGAQEVVMSMVTPAELWMESGRWDAYGKELLRLRDRHDRDFCLGPTHEEVVTDMVRREVRSYRSLPLNLFQIQTKFRDEIRPRFGLMRGREFIMKDAYSFHADQVSAEREYRNMYDAYSRIFTRCGLAFRAVEADTGNIGGSFSHEFMVLADTGEDAVAGCLKCDYAANVERAERRIGKAVAAPQSAPAVERVSTPKRKSVDEVSAFLGVAPSSLIKTLIYETDSGAVAVLVPGDRDVNEIKLKRALGVAHAVLASDEMVTKATGAPCGFAGPVGLKIPIVADHGVKLMSPGVTGANEADAHLRNVVPERDFSASYHDLTVAVNGDDCPRCEGKLEIRRGIEVGHIFMLGTKYSEALKCVFLDESGAERPMIMGCYGIGIGRTAAAAVEQNHDEAGIIWPVPLSPFEVEVVPVSVSDPDTMKTAEAIYEGFLKDGVRALIDDRDERAGVKFKDSDLIGVPVRVTVSPKTLATGSVEIKLRMESASRLVKVSDATDEVMRIVRRA